MTKCVIFTGGELANPHLLDSSLWENAFVIAADSGYKYTCQLGIMPDLTMGDFDSLGYVPENCGEVMTFPKEKDDADLMLAIREALGRGYDDITIIGALGGRFDHTVSNIQSLGFILNHGGQARIVSETEDIRLLNPDVYIIKRNEKRSLSLLAFSEKVSGVCISGVKYPLDNYEMTNFFSIGLSNVIIEESAKISFKTGQILLIQSNL